MIFQDFCARIILKIHLNICSGIKPGIHLINPSEIVTLLFFFQIFYFFKFYKGFLDSFPEIPQRILSKYTAGLLRFIFPRILL